MTVSATLPRHDLPTWIEGEDVAGADRFGVHYPYTGEVIGSAPRLSRAEVGRVLDQAVTRRFDEPRVGSVNIREVPGDRTELTPFGGTKGSGLGVKEGVVEALKAMTFTKLYTLPWE